ncbi:MAG: glycosyltransferase family 39 protein [Planctomycetota bacterium]|nr:glycosyltransferase family 39 protein [Planctomycetota bacterium]
MKNLDISDRDGIRTPIYPAMLLLAGLNYNVVWLMQSVIGVLISLTLYFMVLRLTRSAVWAFIMGLSYSLVLSQIFGEANILTETLSAFLVIVTLAIYLKMQETQGNQLTYYIILGIMAALSALTRPSLLYLVPLLFIFFVIRNLKTSEPIPTRIKYLLGFSIPAVILIFSWCYLNYATIGYWGFTTATGQVLIQRSGPLIEHASDEYADIKQIYYKYRDKQTGEVDAESTMRAACPEIQQKLGISFPQLSVRLTKMSIEILKQYPALYIKSVARAWAKFWKPGIVWNRRLIAASSLGKTYRLIWKRENSILSVLNILFLISPLFLLFWLFLGRVKYNNVEFLLLIISIVLCASIVQALLQDKENRRYAIPFEPLMIFVVLIILHNFIFAGRKQPQTETVKEM